MGIHWTSDNYVKLLAALLAAHPAFKPNYKEIAVCFGDGATYDAIQNCMKPIKKRADQLRAEVSSGQRPGTPPKGTPRKRNLGRVKGKRLLDEDVDDDEEIYTPSKKRAKIEDEFSPDIAPVRASLQKKGDNKKKVSLQSTVIDLTDSDDGFELVCESPTKLESDIKVEVKAEALLVRDYYESEDDYYE